MRSHQRLLMLTLGTFFSAATVRNATAQPKYTITDLGTLGGSSSFAYGINISGHVLVLEFLGAAILGAGGAAAGIAADQALETSLSDGLLAANRSRPPSAGFAVDFQSEWLSF
jgi:uncharacterized membrane protein